MISTASAFPSGRCPRPCESLTVKYDMTPIIYMVPRTCRVLRKDDDIFDMIAIVNVCLFLDIDIQVDGYSDE